MAIDNDLLSGGSSLAENESANISQTSSGQGTDTHLADNSQESQSPTVQGVELDINTTVSTNDFDIATSGDVKSFTPKDGFAFNKVVEIDTDSSQTKELYQTSDTNKFVTKVEYNTNNHEVELYMGNESYKLEKVSLQGEGGKHEWVNQSSEVPEKEEEKPMEGVEVVIEKKLEELSKEFRKGNELDRVTKDLQRQLQGVEQLEDEISEVFGKSHKKEQLRKVKNDMEKEKEGMKNVVKEVNELRLRRGNVIKREIEVVKRADTTLKAWDQVAGIDNDQFNARTDKWEEDKMQDFKREVDGLMNESIKNVRNEMKDARQNFGSVESKLDNIRSEIVNKMKADEWEKLKVRTKKMDATIENMDKVDDTKKRMEQVDIDKEEDEVADRSVERKETDAEIKEQKDESKELTELEQKELEQWKRDLQQQLNQIMNELNELVKVETLDFDALNEPIKEFERNLESAMDDTDEEKEYENLVDNSVIEELEKIVLETKKLDAENKEVEKEMKEVENIVTIKDVAELETLKTDLEEELKWVTDNVRNMIEKARTEAQMVESVKKMQEQKAEELKKCLKEVEIAIEVRKDDQKEFEKKELGNVLKELTKDLRDDSEGEKQGNDLEETSDSKKQVTEVEKNQDNEDQGNEIENNEQRKTGRVGWARGMVNPVRWVVGLVRPTLQEPPFRMESSESSGTDPSSGGTTPTAVVTGSDSSQSGGNSSSTDGSTSAEGQASQGSGSTSSGSSGGSTAKNGVDIDITSHNQTTGEFVYKMDGDFVSYSAKDNNAFKSVKDGSTDIWQATDDSEFSNKIEVEASGDVKSVTINICVDKKRIFIKDGTNEPWNEIHPDKINPKPVNIKATNQIYFYSNELNGSTRTFEAQEGFAFNEVTEGTGSNKVVIWNTTVVQEYASKVVVEGGNMVTIHCGDDSSPTSKVFNKTSDGKWKDASSSQAGSSTPGTDSSSASPAAPAGTSERSDSTSPDVLNITSQAATNVFDYKKDGNFVTFTAKGTNVFKSVLDDNTEVWKTSDVSNVSSKVEVDNMFADAKAVTIYLPDNTTKVFIKNADDTKFTEIDTTKVHPKAVNIKRRDTTHFYNNSVDGSVRTFTPKRGFGFSDVIDTIERKTVVIWKKGNLTEYPTKIVVEGDDKVFIHFGDDANASKMQFNKASNNKWNEIRSGTTKSCYDLNISLEDSADEFEIKKQGKYFTYTSKGNYTFKAVMDGSTKVWEVGTDNIYSYKVEVDNIFSHSKAVTVFLDDNSCKIFKNEYQSGKWRPIDTNIDNPVALNIKREHMTYFCTNTVDSGVRTFEAKKGFVFNDVHEVIEGTKVEIWKTAREKEFATKVILEGDNKVTIHSKDNSKKVFNKGSDGKWEQDTSSQSAGGGKSSHGSSSGGSSDGSSTSKTCFDLNLTSDASTSEFDYKKDGNFVTFTAKGTNVFKSVLDDNTEVWKTSDVSNVSSKVEVDNMFADAKAVTIYLPDNTTKVFIKNADDTKFTEIDTTKVHPKAVNIKRRDTTHFYNNSVDGSVRTFTPKLGFRFSDVIDTFGIKSVVIWKKGDQIDYALKVEVDAEKKVTIHIGEGNNAVKKVFVREDINDPWDEIDLSKLNPRVVNISDTKVTYFYSIKSVNNVRSFEAKPHFAFNIVNDSINNNMVQIWKANNDRHFATKVDVEGDSILTIHIGEGNKASKKVFMRDGKSDPWDTIDLSKLNPRSVNISASKPTYFYKFETVNDVRTFDAKEQFAFNCVKDGTSDLWSTTNENEFANKVVSVKRHSGSLDLTIHLPSDKKKLFVKETSSSSWTEIDLTKKNPKPVNIKDDKDTYFFTYKFENDIRTFQASDGFSFNCVKDGTSDLWSTTNENEFANKVVSVKRHSGSLDLTIHLPSDKKKLFVKETSSSSWTEIDLTKKNPKPVNIKDDKDTYFFTYKFENDIRTFQASDGFSFNCVKDGTSDLWSTTNENEFANKVVSVKRHSGSLDLTIHLPSDKKKLFVKETSSSSWTEIDLTKKNPKPVNIKDDKDTYFFTYKFENDIRTFQASDGFSFNCVKDGTSDIWKASKENKFAKKIVAEEGEVTVHSGEGDNASVIVFIKQEDGIWKNTSGTDCSFSCMLDWITGLCSSCGGSRGSSSSSPGELNINSDKSNDNFDYNKAGSYVTYTAKGDNAFQHVKDDKTTIWEASDVSVRSNKVEVDNMINDAKAVTIYLDGNKTKVFKKDGKDKPWKEIDTSKINPILVDIKHHHDTYFCSSKVVNNVRTFETRIGFMFNGVREENTQIWATSKANEYAKKIVVDGDKVTVHIGVDSKASTLDLKKGDDGNWSEEGSA
ncbi:hypothetical protein MACK_000523 [Theileria orientalis]|uniref:Uncharacterized protein n=1 Tax=Theileria orientalis TaxID=68886 RepID=A0A976MA41_THEOR|nr:hypothetical protein MACK_000523 [Theileria orientalis]